MSADSTPALVLWIVGGALMGAGFFCLWLLCDLLFRRDADDHLPGCRVRRGARPSTLRAPRSFASWHRKLRKEMQRAEREMHRYYRNGHLR